MSKVIDRVDSFLLIAIVFSAFVLAACLGAGTANPGSAGAAEKKTCTLDVTKEIAVKQFDGDKVYWTDWGTATIPVGSHTLTFDFHLNLPSGGVFALDDIVVTYDRFKAGHAYLLTARFGVETSPGMPIGVGIKDITNDPDWAAKLRTASWSDGFEWLPATRLNAADKTEKLE